MKVDKKQLISDNHKLIMWFSHSRGLDLEEYYDILAICLCKAANDYNPERGKFSTVAYKYMENGLNTHFRYICRDRRIPQRSISSYEGAEEVGDFIELSVTNKSNATEEIAIGNMNYLKLIGLLTEKEKGVAQALADGLRQTEIAKLLGCSQQYVGQIKSRIKKKFEKYFEEANNEVVYLNKA